MCGCHQLEWFQGKPPGSYHIGIHVGPEIWTVSRVFANGQRDRGSIPSSSHAKDSKNGT